MCGILACINYYSFNKSIKKINSGSKLLKHRGPDDSGIWIKNKTILSHRRLALIDLKSGRQPIVSYDNNSAIIINGEIYNYLEIKEEILKNITFLTNSDSEVILYLWLIFKEKLFNIISGDFAFVVSDGYNFIAARDPIGVCPLYYGRDDDNVIWFSSEMKALNHLKYIQTFPPGYYYTLNEGFVNYYKPYWYTLIPSGNIDLRRLKNSFEDAVMKRTMSNVPFGVLLSGGLDSSLVAAVLCKNFKNIHSFSCSFSENAPDTIAAKRVADFIGSNHHSFVFSIEEGIKVLTKVIWHLETYDITTIRASIPMFLLSKKIKELGFKMVLSGEGSDEIFGGYLYFHNTNDKVKFHKENVRRVKNLYLADCLRANKSMMANGVEVRVPFLDKDFLNEAFNFDPEYKLITKDKKEKWILRKAFENYNYLPQDLLWRGKEQFSDGVGYDWIDSLKEYASYISDKEFSNRFKRFPYQTPETKEGFLYRKIFSILFDNNYCQRTVKIWKPKWSESKDPSGRVQKAHESFKID